MRLLTGCVPKSDADVRVTLLDHAIARLCAAPVRNTRLATQRAIRRAPNAAITKYFKKYRTHPLGGDWGSRSRRPFDCGNGDPGIFYKRWEICKLTPSLILTRHFFAGSNERICHRRAFPNRGHRNNTFVHIDLGFEKKIFFGFLCSGAAGSEQMCACLQLYVCICKCKCRHILCINVCESESVQSPCMCCTFLSFVDISMYCTWCLYEYIYECVSVCACVYVNVHVCAYVPF